MRTPQDEDRCWLRSCWCACAAQAGLTRVRVAGQAQHHAAVVAVVGVRERTWCRGVGFVLRCVSVLLHRSVTPVDSTSDRASLRPIELFISWINLLQRTIPAWGSNPKPQCADLPLPPRHPCASSRLSQSLLLQARINIIVHDLAAWHSWHSWHRNFVLVFGVDCCASCLPAAPATSTMVAHKHTGTTCCGRSIQPCVGVADAVRS